MAARRPTRGAVARLLGPTWGGAERAVAADVRGVGAATRVATREEAIAIDDICVTRRWEASWATDDWRRTASFTPFF